MMVDILKQVGTLHWLRDWLYISQQTGASCSAHYLSADGGILSGPAAFLTSSLLERFLTSVGWTRKGCGKAGSG